MRRAIVVDAGCDLSERERKALGIELWPIAIVHPAAAEIDVRDENALCALYRKGADSLSEASSKPVEQFVARAKLLEYTTRQDELLYLAIMSARSPALQHAKQAADSLPIALQTERKIRKLPNFRFVAHDSQQLLAGYAWLGAYAALRLRVHAQAEYAIQDTITDVEHAAKNVSGYLIPGQLKTIRERAMRKGEKSVGFLGYALGTALDIKPIIACRSGKTGAVGRVRGFENALNEVVGAVIRQIEQGQLLEPLITLVYGGELSGLAQYSVLEKLEIACRKHSVRLLRSMMSVTGLVNIGAGGFSIGLCSKVHPYGNFALLK